MALLPAPTPSPATVHRRACELLGVAACWQREKYYGGLYSTAHFRVCSHCSCIHPEDLIELLHNGGRLEPCRKPGKFLLFTPNPVAGQLVRRGSVVGRVFAKANRPADLVSALWLATDPELRFHPTIGERLTGHFEHPREVEAPAEIEWPFYADHTCDRQWARIAEAANHGAQHEIPSA